jgi:hypothetical protein
MYEKEKIEELSDSKKRVVPIIALVVTVFLIGNIIYFYMLPNNIHIREEALSVAIDNENNLHVVWFKYWDKVNLDVQRIKQEIHYMKFDGTGKNLVPDKTLTVIDNDSPHITGSAIAVSSGNVYMSFEDGYRGIAFMKTDMEGNVLIPLTDWKNITMIQNYSVVEDDFGNILYLGRTGVIDLGNNIHVVSEARNPSSLSYTKVRYDGTQLKHHQLIRVERYSNSMPSADIDSNDHIHIAWVNWEDEISEIYYSKIDSNGTLLIEGIRLTFDPSQSYYPIIKTNSNDDAHILYKDYKPRDYVGLYYTKINSIGNVTVDELRLDTYGPSTCFSFDASVDNDDNFNILTMKDGRLYLTKLGYSGETIISQKKIK